MNQNQNQNQNQDQDDFYNIHKKERKYNSMNTTHQQQSQNRGTPNPYRSAFVSTYEDGGFKTPQISHRYDQAINSQVWGQSASTWRYSSNSFSFPKGDRFARFDQSKRRVQSPIQNPEYHDIPTTKTQKYCTLGKGTKQYITNDQMRNALTNPSPGYTQEIIQKPKVKNVSMGTSNRFDSLYSTNKNYPPVGTYNVEIQTGKDKPKFTFKDRFDDLRFTNKPQSPAPDKYEPNDFLTQNKRFQKITFGKGNKIDFTKCDKDIPPVGSYKTYSCFDKFKNLQQKMMPNPHQKKVHKRFKTLNQINTQLQNNFLENEQIFN